MGRKDNEKFEAVSKGNKGLDYLTCFIINSSCLDFWNGRGNKNRCGKPDSIK